MEGASSRTSVMTIDIMVSQIENPTLPFDIIAEVIHHLESDANALTLRALSTTCHILRRPSQRKLFCNLEILVTSGQPYAYKHNPPTYFALNDLLNTSPYLASYVRHLTVTFRPPYPPTVSIIASVLDKMCSITSLRINHIVWPDEYPRRILQLRECASVVLCRPSLRKLDLKDCGELPASVWQVPTLTDIDLGYWRVGEVDMSDSRPIVTWRLAISWLLLEDHGAPSRLRTFLRISPLLTHLTVSCISDPLGPSPFRGLSGAIISSAPTLSTLETLTFRFFWSLATPLSVIAEELIELSLSNGSVLQKIRIDLCYYDGVYRGEFLGQFEDFDKAVYWTRFRHLRELEVNIYEYDTIIVTDWPRTETHIKDIEMGICNSFKGLKNGDGDEVMIKASIVNANLL